MKNSGLCKKCGANLEIKENCYFYTRKNGKVFRECRTCSKIRCSNRQSWRRTNEPGFREAQNKKVQDWRKRTGDPKGKKRTVERARLRLASDRSYRLKHYLRNRLRDALHGKTKSAKTLALLGCTVGALENHLESLFVPGMSWENYGEWHIDHIVPCAHFDLNKEEEQRLCFHWTNLQPLWAKDNREKSNKISFVKETQTCSF